MMGVKFPSPPMCRNSLKPSAYDKNCRQKSFLRLTYAVMLVNCDPIIFCVVYNCRIQNVLDCFFRLPSACPIALGEDYNLSSLLPVAPKHPSPLPTARRINALVFPPCHLWHRFSSRVPSPLRATSRIKPRIPLPCLLPQSRATRLPSSFRAGSRIKPLNHNPCRLPHWFARKLPFTLAAPCVIINRRTSTPAYTHEMSAPITPPLNAPDERPSAAYECLLPTGYYTKPQPTRMLVPAAACAHPGIRPASRTSKGKQPQ